MQGKETIVVIGFGWVGQANALALSFLNYSVFYYDIGTPELRYQKEWGSQYEKIKRLSTPLEQDGVRTWYLLAVGDRVSQEGVQDVSLVRKASDMLRGGKGGVILRSTILPEHLPALHFDYYFPEFLHEQYAVEECLNPFYFVLGDGTTTHGEPDFLKEWERRAHKSFRGSAEEASYIKYLSNIWNALRIAFTNEMGDIVSRGGQDRAKASRVLDFIFEEKAYLRYGRAYGGHCLPKDTLAFARSNEDSAVLVQAVHNSNERHKQHRSYESLPTWLSQWELDGGISDKVTRIWKTLNRHIFIRVIRKALRPLRRLLGRFAPTRSLSHTKRLWNKRAKKRPLYFSHPGTESGYRVNEYEFRESGKKEYISLVTHDVNLQILGDLQKRTVLDLGAGAGRHLESFVRDFGQVIGVDISEEMIAIAERRLSGFKNVKLLVTDGRHLPVPDASVDMLFSRETFQSIADLRVVTSYLSEIFRVLRSGGVSKVELRAEKAVYPWLYTYGLAFTPDEATELFSGAGLSVVSVVPEGSKYLWVTARKP